MRDQVRHRYLYGAGCWAIFIWTSATFMRPLLNLLEATLGAGGVTGLVWIFFGITVGLAISMQRSRLDAAGVLKFLPVLLFGVVAAALMDVTAERVHILKYGILGFLLASSAGGASVSLALAKALIGALIVSGVDEAFQYFLPNRVGDLRDVFFGVIGATWGAMCSLWFSSTAKTYSVKTIREEFKLPVSSVIGTSEHRGLVERSDDSSKQ